MRFFFLTRERGHDFEHEPNHNYDKVQVNGMDDSLKWSQGTSFLRPK